MVTLSSILKRSSNHAISSGAVTPFGCSFSVGVAIGRVTAAWGSWKL